MNCTIRSDGSWFTSISGCRTNDGQTILPGESAKEDEQLVECLGAPGGRVEIRRSVVPGTNCEGHRIGESWVSKKNFNKTCNGDGSVKIVNCLSDSGIPFPLNTHITFSGIRYSCTERAGGQVVIERENVLPNELLGKLLRGELGAPDDILSKPNLDRPFLLSPSNEAVTCNGDGITRQPEETWISENKFTKKCTPSGAVIILNCVINENISINVDSTVRIGKKVYGCTRKDGSVFYEERLA